MNEEIRRKYEEKMMEDERRIMEAVNSDPSLRDVKAPPEMREKLFEAIRAKEAEEDKKRLSEEERELIRLGKLYQKKRKNKKYLVLAAAMVLVLAFGITSIGGAEKVFETFRIMALGREQIQVNSSEKVVAEDDLTEEKAYEEIEKEFGFYPVKLDYLPQRIVFQEAELDEKIPRIYMFFGAGEEVKISYIIHPNYKEGSWGKDIEDELLDEYEIKKESTIVQVKKYLVADETVRWSVQFVYKDVNYSMQILDMEENEVDKIIENLYFF